MTLLCGKQFLTPTAPCKNAGIRLPSRHTTGCCQRSCDARFHDSRKRAERQCIRKTRDDRTRLETRIGDSSEESPALAEPEAFIHFRMTLDELLASRCHAPEVARGMPGGGYVFCLRRFCVSVKAPFSLDNGVRNFAGERSLGRHGCGRGVFHTCSIMPLAAQSRRHFRPVMLFLW